MIFNDYSRGVMDSVERIRFEECIAHGLRCLNLEHLSLRKEQVAALENVVVLKKDAIVVLPTGFGKSVIFQLLPFVFDAWFNKEDKHSMVLVVSPLNALIQDQVEKMNSQGVNSLMVRNNESLSPVEIRDIKEGCYRLIYGHPEAFVGKLKRIFDCKTVNERVQAIV